VVPFYSIETIKTLKYEEDTCFLLPTMLEIQCI